MAALLFPEVSSSILRLLAELLIKYGKQDAKDNENHKEPETGSVTYHLLFILAICAVIIYNFNKDDYY